MLATELLFANVVTVLEQNFETRWSRPGGLGICCAQIMVINFASPPEQPHGGWGEFGARLSLLNDQAAVMELHELETMMLALSKDPMWFAIYSWALLLLFSLVVGTKTVVRCTLFLCILPSLRAIRSGQADVFWARFWMVVGLASNLGLPSSIRAMLFIWCAAPHHANGTDVIFSLIQKIFV
ncbi:hypothetical protein BIW11_03574 [Tropilaelaps mercedesae]|uniref:Uncharacterized protein n=1 Tax=Tropilaelaps mercedesae TaxID=418985 RepID=A0A1V9XJ48_9ACAR|nr:hypothetical protein BIW11_03574 [Tropilaelaps mercedesae]